MVFPAPEYESIPIGFAEAKDKALSFLIEWGDKPFPEDDWFAIDKRWDLNLWNDGIEVGASLHYVDDEGFIEPDGYHIAK